MKIKENLAIMHTQDTDIITSDNGTEFANEATVLLANSLGTMFTFTLAHRPQVNSIAERVNKITFFPYLFARENVALGSQHPKDPKWIEFFKAIVA